MHKKIMNLLKLVFIFTIIISIGIMCITTADVGNLNRYDGDSYDYDYDNDYSSDGDSDGIIFLIFMLLDTVGPVGTIIIIIILLVCMKIFKNNKGSNNNELLYNKVQETRSAHVDNNPVAEIKRIDPAFSEEKFIAWTNEVFMKLQQAWTERNWKVIRPFESEELFSQHNMQLQEYINKNRINVIERVAIKNTIISKFSVDGDKETIVVKLSAVMRDYIIDATTKQVIESDPNHDWNMKYLLTFARKAGVKTTLGTSNKSTTNCPNCGAPTQITSAGQCEYCGSVITTGEHDWVLTNIKSY